MKYNIADTVQWTVNGNTITGGIGRLIPAGTNLKTDIESMALTEGYHSITAFKKHFRFRFEIPSTPLTKVVYLAFVFNEGRKADIYLLDANDLTLVKPSEFYQDPL